MAGIRSVLVGLDGSAHSLVALRWAGWCAAATGADLHVAHAWQQGPPLDGALGAGIADAADLEAAVERRLRQLAAAELRDPGAVAGARALRGEVPTALTREAARLDAGLVVVGARGAGNALRALLGSTASRLTECPVRAVAVVPDDAEVPPRSGAGLLVGVDGSTGASRAVRWAAAVARAARRPVVAVHAFEPGVPDLTPEEGESLLGEARLRLDEEWVAPLRARGVEHRTVVEPGDPRDVLPRVADAERPAGVVVGSRGLGPISQRLLGSVTHHLLRTLAWPTVVIPAPRDCVVWSP
ncbi:MAG: universal stress protein [Thermoanaerobacterales bacterium]